MASEDASTEQLCFERKRLAQEAMEAAPAPLCPLVARFLSQGTATPASSLLLLPSFTVPEHTARSTCWTFCLLFCLQFVFSHKDTG